MKIKLIGFILCLLISLGIMNKINEIETYNDKHIPVVKTKEIKKKSKKEKELDKWSKIVGYKVKSVKKIKAKLSFYTDLDCENYQGCNGKTASGVRLYDGVVANNSMEFGTKIYFKGYGEYEVLDRGGAGLDSWVNFDMYIPRNYGESDENYFRRINNLGVKNVDAWIIK